MHAGPRSVDRHGFMALLAVMTLSLAAAGCTAGSVAEARPDPAPGSSTTAPRATDVTLTADELRSGGIAVEAPRVDTRAGGVSASAVLHLDETRTARLGSVVDGVVVESPIQTGTRVSKGARLATIHSHLVHEARAEYRRALAERRRASTELAFIKDAEARTSRLLAAKAASRQEAERARTDRAAAEEALVIADSEVQRALEGMEHLGIEPDAGDASASRDALPIVATVGGVVLERLVTPGTAVTAGTPLFVISDLSRLWAVAEIDERRLPAISVGDTAELTVAAYPGRMFEGRVIAVGDTVNPETRRVTARILMLNADGALKPQMFATARFTNDEGEPVLLVPAAAVQKVDQEPVVFVERDAGRFVQRPVTLGTERDGYVEIRQGLTADDRVAVSGTFLLKSKFLEAGLPE